MRPTSRLTSKAIIVVRLSTTLPQPCIFFMLALASSFTLISGVGWHHSAKCIGPVFRIFRISTIWSVVSLARGLASGDPQSFPQPIRRKHVLLPNSTSISSRQLEKLFPSSIHPLFRGSLPNPTKYNYLPYPSGLRPGLGAMRPLLSTLIVSRLIKLREGFSRWSFVDAVSSRTSSRMR